MAESPPSSAFGGTRFWRDAPKRGTFPLAGEGEVTLVSSPLAGVSHLRRASRPNGGDVAKRQMGALSSVEPSGRPPYPALRATTAIWAHGAQMADTQGGKV